MDSLLAPLLALTGHCFVAEISPGTTDEHCFNSVYDGRHVRDVHVVTKGNRVVYQGETIYSVEGAAIALTYFSSTGGIGRGTALLAPDDWRFTMTMRATSSAKLTPITVRWNWQGATSYTVSGGHEPVTYRRTVKLPSPPVRQRR